jgi:all-trans-retinol 13,14-reductase
VHGFIRQGFHFDSGASFYCGIGHQHPSLNPLRQVLDVLEEQVEVVPYDPLGHYHFPDVTLPIYSDLDQYRQAVAQVTPQGAKELAKFEQRLLDLYKGLKDLPTIALRSDWQVIFTLFPYLPSMLKMLPQLGIVNGSVGQVMDATIQDSWVRRLINIECFLLSGMKAHDTIAPEVAFMLGERNRAGVEYPVGGSAAIVSALVRGLKKWGGELRLGTHVEEILVRSQQAKGIRLQDGTEIYAPIVISNATIWDTYGKLLKPENLPQRNRAEALATPAVESFMHLHLGIRADGLDNLTGHHVVIHDNSTDITTPGNTCMISIPSVWDHNLAPQGHHVVHAYTLEPYEDWGKDGDYKTKKREKVQPLYRALEKVIPDVRDRVTLELIGTPLTHSRFLRRYQGTYGAAISAQEGMFPSCHTPIAGLYRVGDSTLPGIGVPAVAASGILCANTLVSPGQIQEILKAI